VAGHSKWANIKRKKEREDAGRGKLFTKAARRITIAAREGGGDPDANFRLRIAIDAAKAINMPNDNIQRAIKRGTGELDSGSVFEETIYEAYGPGGIALLIEIATDNRNRTISEIRYILSKYNASLGEAGCVAWMFERVGLVEADGDLDEDQLLLTALEAGATDAEKGEDGFEITCEAENLQQVEEALNRAGLKVKNAEITRKPKNTIPVSLEQADKIADLVEALEENDDVQAVYTNMELTEEIITHLESK